MSDTSNAITRLWHLTEDAALDVDNPPIAMITDAINALDGDEINWVAITPSNGTCMEVGGGKPNQYMCCVRTKNRITAFYLLNPACPRDETDLIPINMGEDAYTYPRCTLVSLESVIIAVVYFCSSGELNPNLTWDNTLEFNIA